MRKKQSVILSGSVIIIAIGIAVIFGWVFKIDFLKSIFPDFATMKFNTSLGFILLGISSYLIGLKKRLQLSIMLAFIVFSMAFLTISQELFNYDLGIDQLFVIDADSQNYPGRMSQLTAICFCLMATSFIGIQFENKNYRLVCQVLLHVVTLMAFIGIMGYLFNVPIFYKFTFLSSMAIHTALAFLILSISAALVNPSLGIAGLFTGVNIGNKMARSLFAQLTIITLILAYLTVLSYRYKILSVEYGIVLFALSFILTSLFLIWRTSRELNFIDQKRAVVENGLIEAKQDLEVLTKRLTEQNVQLANFVHITSHNLRSPVSNLNSLLYLYKTAETEEDKNSLFEKFETVIIHLSSTLNTLVDALRIKENTDNEREIIQFEDVLSKTTEIISAQIIETGARIKGDFENALEIEYNSGYLESIFLNLLTNAIKYRTVGRPPKIELKTERINDQLVLTVSDNGMGIDLKRHRHKLFGLHKTFHRHTEAKGVGLFMTKTQIEKMGGTISAESEVGKGSIFTIKF